MKDYSVIICDNDYLSLDQYDGNGIRLDGVTGLELDELIQIVTKNKDARLIIIGTCDMDD